MRYLLFALALALPAAAQDMRETDLELVLLADASGSIDAGEIAFQRQGYATAITDPMVIAAIQNTLYGSIAVTYVEWATNQVTVVDWMIISDITSARAFADALMGPPRMAYGRNAIGGALLEGKRLIETNDIDGFRRIIDFSGDSINNHSGPPIALARAEVLDAGITINGLPILRPGRYHGANLPDLYAQQIIGGPGAFVVPAESGDEFATAVRRKLFLEIAGLTPTVSYAALR